MSKSFVSLAVAFISMLINATDPNTVELRNTLLPTDVLAKIQAKQIKPRSEDIYLRGAVSWAVGGSSAIPLIQPQTRKAVGITNLLDGNKLSQNEFFACTHVGFAYWQSATTANITADLGDYSNVIKTLTGGAYVQRIPTLVLNSEIELVVNGRKVYRSLVSDMCVFNNVNERATDTLFIPLDAPCLITDNDTVAVNIYPPVGGAVVGGTISEWIDFRLHGAKYAPIA